MVVDVSAPDYSFKRYLADTKVNLTKEKQTFQYPFTYDYTITDKDDGNGRLEFNLGNTDSTAAVHISNVKVTKVSGDKIDDSNAKKTVLADGNYVYNGSFQEGTGRLGYWSIQKPDSAKVSVTNENNIRKCKIEASSDVSPENPVILSQKELALTDGDYAASFYAEGEQGKKITMMIAGQEIEEEMDGKGQEYNDKFSFSEALAADRDIKIIISEPGVYYLDDVRIVEDTLIKNGSFNGGLAGYESFVDGSASASCVVDSLTEDHAVDFTVQDTGDADWKIQLKQSNVLLEKGQWYRLSLKAKSNLNRKITIAIQRNGAVHKNPDGSEDWTPYTQGTMELSGDIDTYDIYTKESRWREKPMRVPYLTSLWEPWKESRSKISIESVLMRLFWKKLTLQNCRNSQLMRIY